MVKRGDLSRLDIRASRQPSDQSAVLEVRAEAELSGEIAENWP